MCGSNPRCGQSMKAFQGIMIELLHYMKMIAMVTTMTNEIKSATSVVTTNESTTVDNKNYDELIREFHRFWDVFPGIARLITKNHRFWHLIPSQQRRGS